MRQRVKIPTRWSGARLGFSMSGVGSVSAEQAVWNLPATLSVQQGGNIPLRQYALNSEGWQILVSNLPAGVTYNSGLERLEGAAAGTSSGTATFTLTRVGGSDVVATATVALVEQASGFVPEAGFTVNGSFVDGGTITITKLGGGFGTKQYAAPIIWDMGADTRHNGTTDARHASAVDGDAPSFYDGPVVNTVIDVASTHRHARVDRHYRRNSLAGNDDAYIQANAKLRPSDSSRKFFSAFKIRYSADPNSFDGVVGSSSAKLWRINQQANDGVLVVAQLDLSQFWVESNSGGVDEIDMSRWTTVNYNAVTNYTDWMHVELFLDFSSPSGITATHRAAGVLGSDEHVIPPQNGANNWLNQGAGILLFGHDGTRAKPMEIHFGEHYADDTPQRVVATEGASYSGSQEIEIFCPVAWSDTQIQAEIYQGAFATMSGKYLWWVNASNQPELIGRFE